MMYDFIDGKGVPHNYNVADFKTAGELPPKTQVDAYRAATEPTLTEWQAALIAAEKRGWQLTWGDGARIGYVLLMAVLGIVGAIIILGGVW